MSETIYHEKDGASPPGGMPPSDLNKDMARATEALEEEQELDSEKRYGRVERDLVGPTGNPSPRDHGRSSGLTRSEPHDH